jgi:hypothetical protein
VRAEPRRRARVVAAEDDVARQQPHLAALVDGAAGDRQALAVVAEAQRRGERHRRALYRRDRHLVVLRGIEVGGADDQSVAGAPVGRALEDELRGPGRRPWRRGAATSCAARRAGPPCRR